MGSQILGMNHHRLTAQALLAVVAIIMSGCITPRKGRTQPRPVPQTETRDKAGLKDPDARTSLASPGAAGPTERRIEALPPLTAAEKLAFIKAQRAPGAEFGEPEHQFVSHIPSSPEPGSIDEAVLALGLIKTILHPRHLDTITFKETDLSGAPTESGTGSLSLERLAKDRGLDLADALVENPFLAGYGVAKQTIEALDKANDSPEFRTEVAAVFKRQADLWSALGATMSATQTASEPSATADDSMPPNPADLRGGDAVLSEAQALADRGQYAVAIRKAASITPSHPIYPMAQEKIREFSNMAVQELRRKAASAFQSATPVTDAKTRAAYLRQAKDYLEEAIQNFPSAPQIPTVRDNLRAISRDLERLEEAGH